MSRSQVCHWGSVLASAVLVCWLTVSLGCLSPREAGSPASAEGPTESGGPIVVLTLSSMRADLVGFTGGEPGWTRSLDRLAKSADWAGTAVSASSSPIPALGSLLTGVDPWRHQALHHRVGRIRPDLPTLAESLLEIGYSTAGFFPLRQGLHRFGFFAGFREVGDVSDLTEAVQTLEALQGRRLVWVHLPGVSFPYRDGRATIPRLAGRPVTREALEGGEVMPFADPNRPLTPDLGFVLAELYRHDLAAADLRIGRLLDALRRSPEWERTTVVVTALHGLEIGEHDQALYAQNLGRESIEVPLLIKLPASNVAELTAEKRVSATRVWSTLITLAGGRPSPAHGPDLFHTSDGRMMSSLYLHDGKNRFSLVIDDPAGTTQLRLVHAFHPAELEFYAAQALEAGAPGIEISESPRQIYRRLDVAFGRALPMTGRGPTELHLESWVERGRTAILNDQALEQQMAAELRRRWLRFVGEERSPRLEQALWQVTGEE